MAKESSSGSGKKKKSKRVAKSLAMKSKVQKDNPFESIWSRRKFNILGKKRKDEERRRVGLSRSLSVQKRQRTLLNEYEHSTKSSVFVDKRIGEQNEDLEEFHKAILRSQRERKLKLNKKSKFNLSDGEEDDFGIEDSAYFLERDDYEDEEPFDEDDGRQSFGSEKDLARMGKFDPHGAEDDPELRAIQENRPKSKKEVMEDVISKSKYFKAQKAKDKEENEEFIEQLDKDFTSLVQSEALLSLTQPNKMGALRALVNKSISNDNDKIVETSPGQKNVSFQQEQPDTYVKLIGEMALEMRARPSDRTKTPEETAQEEKERLERLEEERKKRMAAADNSSDEDEDTSEDDAESAKRPKHISGDDLGDSFSHDVKSNPKVGWINEVLRKENASDLEGEDDTSSGGSESDDEGSEEGSDDNHDKDEPSQSLKEWEQSDDENIGTNFDDDEEEASHDDDDDDEEEEDDGSGKQVDIVDQKKSSESRGEQNIDSSSSEVKTNLKEDLHQQGELPYTIEAPKNFEELCALLENRSDEQIVEAIWRIRTFNAITVAAENRKKMQVFYGVLLQYFAVLANKKPMNFKLLTILVKPLIEMSSETPYFAAICARERLLRARIQFCEDLKNTGKSCWPSLKTLFLLRLWSMIFPCSDFRHAVMIPAILLMSEYLLRCPIISGRDVAIGSFLCSMLLSVSRQSQKFCPEAVMLIETMLMTALNNKYGFQDSQLYRLMEIKSLKPLLRLQGRVEDIGSLDFLVLMDLPDDSPYFATDNFRVSALFAIIATLKGFVNVYERFKSFQEIFSPVSKLLLKLSEQDHVPDALKVEIKDVIQNIENKSQETYLLRQPLRWKKQKIIKTVAPKFEENFVKGRDYDPDRERAERKKLKKRLKQEAKGAARELRKDNFFLLEAKEKIKARTAEEKAEKSGKNRAFLQEQEHAFKSGQLGNSRKRRR